MTDANKILVSRHKIMISKIVFFVGFLHTYDLFFNIGQMRFFLPIIADNRFGFYTHFVIFVVTDKRENPS